MKTACVKLGGNDGMTMIEYVVLVSGIVVALAAAMVFLPGNTSSFGFVGNAFVVWHQKVQSVLSLPFP